MTKQEIINKITEEAYETIVDSITNSYHLDDLGEDFDMDTFAEIETEVRNKLVAKLSGNE